MELGDFESTNSGIDKYFQDNFDLNAPICDHHYIGSPLYWITIILDHHYIGSEAIAAIKEGKSAVGLAFYWIGIMNTPK